MTSPSPTAVHEDCQANITESCCDPPSAADSAVFPPVHSVHSEIQGDGDHSPTKAGDSLTNWTDPRDTKEIR